MGTSGTIYNGGTAGSTDEKVGSLFTSHAPALKSFCRGLLVDSTLADDAVQQTFEIALKSYQNLRHADRSRAWIFQIARHECYRLLTRSPVVEYREEEHPDAAATPLHDVIIADLRSFVRDAVQELPHKYREAVLLRDMEDFTYAEIAAITGVAVSAVKFRIYKGREMLMEKLQPVMKEWRMP
jgi:RNA polymerase sigma factor (sigma-70 family)